MQAGGGVTAEYRIGPLCWGVDVGDFAAWLRTARPGDVIRYAGGPSLPRSMPIVAPIARALAAGQVRTHLAREDGTIVYFAVRRGPDGSCAQASDWPEPGSAPARMIELLAATARAGKPCPSNAVLAIALGLSGKEQARYALRQLTEAGLVAVRNRGPKLRRIVTILASGERTAG